MKFMHHNLFLISAVFLTLFNNQNTFADSDINDTTFYTMIENSNSINNSDLVKDLQYDLQIVDPVLLIENVKQLKDYLIQQKKKLVEHENFNTSDTLITLVLPGGFLYAGYRLNEIEKTKSEILMIVADLKDLSIDLIALSGQLRRHSKMLALDMNFIPPLPFGSNRFLEPD